MTDEPNQRPDSPWPETDHDVIFLLDVANDVDLDLLHDWISRSAEGRQAVRIVSASLDREIADESLEAALAAPPETLVVPARILWGSADSTRTHPRLRDLIIGDARRLGRLTTRFRLPQGAESPRRLVGTPASIESLRTRFEQTASHASPDHQESFAEFVMHTAAVTLDVEERRRSGLRYKVPRSVIGSVVRRAMYHHAIEEVATADGRPIEEVLSESREYLEEMAATPSTFFIDWSGAFTKKVVGLGYKEIVVDPDALERTRAIVRDNPAAFLFTHKSHVDGIALLSVLYDHDFPTPHQFGGINMAFRGLGGLARRAGTVFIRRTFADNAVYKVTLRQYLSYLMEKRFPFSWSFEGTRSRTGKLMPPRYGVLKYVIDAARSTEVGDLHLVPVAINYDLIGDVSDYARIEAGQPKQKENAGWFVGYLRGLKAPMGNIYLDFAEPVVVETTSDPDDVDLPAISIEVARRVNALVPVTLPALLSKALLGAAPNALTYAELDSEVRALLGWLHAKGVRLADSLEEANETQAIELAEIMFSRGLVERYESGPTTVFSIDPDKTPTATYYANTVAHYFVDKSIAELALCAVLAERSDNPVDAFWDEANALRDLLKFEFFHSTSKDFVASIEAELTRADPDWQTAIAESSTTMSQLIEGLRPVVAPATLRPFLESYWVAADLLADLSDHEHLDEATCIEHGIRAAEQRYRQGHIGTRASIGKQMFAGAHSLFTHRELTGGGGSSMGDHRRQQERELRRLVDLVSDLQRMSQRGSRP